MINLPERLKLAMLLWGLCWMSIFQDSEAEEGLGLRKLEDVVIYQDDRFYSAFPSIVVRPDGEILVAFRRAPNRQVFGEAGSSHTDPNSYLVLVRSRDSENWTVDPELILAHPFGGSQDPCMLQLRDGTILCASYGWARLEKSAAEKFGDVSRNGDFVFMGGFLMRSVDGGENWDGPITPPAIQGLNQRNVFGDPLPVYNRGAMCEGRDGRLFWVVAYPNGKASRTSVHLMISGDKGRTWRYSCPVAEDESVTFNEASLIETPSGDLVAFVRTANFDDHTVIVRSSDGGKSFEKWEDAGFKGHPHHAIHLRDGRMFLVYGYRHKPYGIRARLLDAEAKNISESEEIILRDDGGNGDLGYPWAAQLPDGRILAAYYFNVENGVRHIAGTLLDAD